MMPAKESIYNAIYDIVRAIPRGRVSSYGAIANAIGAKGAARMVGYAMNLSHAIQPKVPAHRVVNRNGMLTGKHHFETPIQMEALLIKEGISVEDDQIVDFEKFFWDPMIEL